MNKKLFLGMFAAVGMLFATSCSNDELDAVQSGNEATVSFTLGVEGGVQTRAISDGKTANRLIYAVFNEKGERITTIAKVEKATTFPTTENITLAKGQTYKVAFWAQNSATSAYVLDDDMNLTIDYTSNGGKNNDEARDAFFKTVEFTVTGNQNVDVVLKRPFAQLNVGVYTGDDDKNGKIESPEKNKDWEYAEASGITIETSKVVIKNAATTLDLVSGNVGGKTDVTYDFSAIPTQWLEVETDAKNEGKEHFKYLSMSYFLVNTNGENGVIGDGDGKANLDGVEFTFRSGGNDIVLGEQDGLIQVPVQRNWRTNIIGKILTGDVTFNIKIDPIYDGEFNGLSFEECGVKAGGKFYATLADALDAEETDIQLGAGEYILNPGQKIKTEMLNITGASTDAKIKWDHFAYGNGINANGAELTFNNVTMVASRNSYTGFQHSGNVTFNDCVFENTYWCYSGASKTNFKNCTFNQSAVEYNVWTYGSAVDFENCKFNCAGKSVLIYSEGGDQRIVNFENCEFIASAPANDGKAAIEISTEFQSYIVNIDNCTSTGFDLGSVSGNSLWNVKKEVKEVEVYVDGKKVDNPVEVNDVKYGNIKAALAAVPKDGTATINLAEGIYDLPNEAQSKNLTFVGTGDAGETIILCNNNVNQGALNGSKVTFENVTIETDNATYRGFQHVAGATFKDCIIKNTLTFYNDGTEPLKFENCTFHASGDNYNFWSWGASATLTDCTFDCDGKGALVYGGTAESTVKFERCTFNDYGGIDGKAAIETGDDYQVKYNIYINACTINGFDVTTQKNPNRGGDDLGTNVWGNKNLMTRENLNVYIDDIEVY